LIITKSDLAGDEEIQRLSSRLAELNPRATQQISVNTDVDAGTLFSSTFFDEVGDASLIGQWITTPDARLRAAAGDRRLPNHDHATHVDGIAAVTLRATVPLDWRQFDLWLGRLQRQHGDAILRIKGIVDVAGEDRPVVVHGVQSVSHVPVSLERWPDADSHTRIVVILYAHLQEEILQRWAAFLESASRTI